MTIQEVSPHIAVVVLPESEDDVAQKWGIEAPGKKSGKKSDNQPTKAHCMLDTGAAITVLTDTWCKKHGVKIAHAKRPRVAAADGRELDIMGTATFTMRLLPHTGTQACQGSGAKVWSIPGTHWNGLAGGCEG